MEPTLFAMIVMAVVIGSFFIIVALMLGAKFDVKWNVVGFIGPFPFGAGNDKGFLKFVLIAALIVFVIIILSTMKGVLS